MIRIYLTADGIEGYNEGCGCCSSTQEASVSDIETLLQKLTCQMTDLWELKSLIEKFGSENLATWKMQFEVIARLRDRINAADKYIQNPEIQGTFYKSCYDTMAIDEETLDQKEKEFSSVPLEFKKYIGYQ